MKLSQFKYNLPKELIAEKPAIDRDASRLMVIHKKTKQIVKKLSVKTLIIGSVTGLKIQ